MGDRKLNILYVTAIRDDQTKITKRATEIDDLKKGRDGPAKAAEART